MNKFRFLGLVTFLSCGVRWDCELSRQSSAIPEDSWFELQGPAVDTGGQDMGKEIESKLFSSHFQKRENSETKERSEVEEGKQGTGAQGCGTPRFHISQLEMGFITNNPGLSIQVEPIHCKHLSLYCQPPPTHCAGPLALRLTPATHQLISSGPDCALLCFSAPASCVTWLCLLQYFPQESPQMGVSFPASTLLLLPSQCLFVA